MMNNNEKRIITTRVTISKNGQSGAGSGHKQAARRSDSLRSGSAGGTRTRSERYSSEVSKSRPETYRSSVPKSRPQAYVSSNANSKRVEKQTKGSLAAELIFTTLLLLAVCSLRYIQLYANNVSYGFELLTKDMWIYMLISVAVYAILRFFIRKPYFAGTFVAFGTFLAVNLGWFVDFMRLFFKTSAPAAIGALVLYLILVTGFFFFIRMIFRKKMQVSIIIKILSVTFTGLVLFNAVMAYIAVGNYEQQKKNYVATISAPPPVESYNEVATPSVTSSDTAIVPIATDKSFGKPNIYFFILDEFSSFDMLSKYYDYDAKPFNDFLVAKGFNISRESYSTDDETEHSICDTFNLNYISRNLTKKQCIDNIRKGALHKVLTDMGYAEYQMANSQYFRGLPSLITGDKIDNSEDNNIYGDQATGDVASDDSISGIIDSLVDNGDSDTRVDTSKLNELGYYPSDYIRDSRQFKQNKLNLEADSLLKKFDYLENSANYSGVTPRVTYCYAPATHVPFLFNEYGGIIPYSQNRNWEKTDVYLNQYKFITKHLVTTLSTIIKNDPESIIILMSDHGIRYHADCTKKHTFYITDKDACRIMNAVYVKGQKLDIEGLSAINTLRAILSLYDDGTKYPPIKDPITKDSPSNLTGIIPHHR